MGGSKIAETWFWTYSPVVRRTIRGCRVTQCVVGKPGIPIMPLLKSDNRARRVRSLVLLSLLTVGSAVVTADDAAPKKSGPTPRAASKGSDSTRVARRIRHHRPGLRALEKGAVGASLDPLRFQARKARLDTVAIVDTGSVTVDSIPRPKKRRARYGRTLKDVEALGIRDTRVILVCYLIGQLDDRSLVGDVVVRLTLTPDGTVRDSSVVPGQTTLDNLDVQECLVAVVSEWIFGEGDAPVTHLWTFTFDNTEPS